MNELHGSELESKFNELCRLCASYDPERIDVFCEEGKKRQLVKKIQSFLPFKVVETDGLPKSVCFKCVYNLENAYKFRFKCIQTNRNLEKAYVKKEQSKAEINEKAAAHMLRMQPEVSIFAIPSDHGQNREINDTQPNPLEFVEVAVDQEDCLQNNVKQQSMDTKKQYLWKSEKRWLSVEHKKIQPTVQQNDSTINMKYFDLPGEDNSLNRRKNCNPRKIAREEPKDPLTPSSSFVPVSTGTTATPSTELIPISSIASTSSGIVHDNESYADVHVPAVTVKEEETEDPNKPFTCLLCEKSFTLRSSLNKHFSTIHGIEPYEVNCQTPILSQALTRNQVPEKSEEEFAESMVEQEVVLLCEVCRREFHDRASLWLHMVHAHREEAAVSCGICLKVCCDNITLIEHVNTAHAADKVVQRRYSCQVCGRQHDSRQKLLKHATLHTLIDNQGQTIQPEEMVLLNNAFAPRDCTFCHRKFFSEEKLNLHMQNFHSFAVDSLASNAVVFKCELCPSTHATRMDRWWHMYHSHNGDSRVTCKLKTCRKVFVAPSLLEEHAKNHHQAQGSYTNACEICGKLWETKVVFYKHMMNVHSKCLPSICGVCLKVFSNVPELRLHVQTEHMPLDAIGCVCCDVCGRPYAERSKMLRHRRVHNVTDEVPPPATNFIKKKDDLQCNMCPELKFETGEEIAEHRKVVHRLFVCDLCPKYYNGNNHLWKHVSKQHKGDPNVTCNLCHRTSASRAHLDRHKLKYHSDPVEKIITKPNEDPVPVTHKCTLCNRVFRIRSLLNKHSKSCKGVKPVVPKMVPVNGVFPCSKCPKVFEQPNLLSKHMKMSHVTYYCEICEVETKVGFDTKKGLLLHIREQHPGNPELHCDYENCNKVLRTKVDLKKHKSEHGKSYFSYVCEVCGDLYSNKKKMRKHLQTNHRADSKYLCAVCNAIAPTIDDLVDHVHSSHSFVLRRPCTCQICGKCWTVGSKVIDHISKIHGPEYKTCKICWKVFVDEKEFKNHVDNHPPAEEKPITPASRMTSNSAASSSRNRSSKSGMTQELAALGISIETDGTLKRPADTVLDSEDPGKRLRMKYKCPYCKDTFRSTSDLQEHKTARHANEINNFSNSADKYEAEEQETLLLLNLRGNNRNKWHEKWTDVHPMQCDKCRRMWNSKKQLWQHLIRSHPVESMYTCGICLRVCKNYSSLAYHLDTHHSEIMNDDSLRFKCHICGHHHNTQCKLDKHSIVHKNPPRFFNYSCSECGRVFKSNAYYHEHLQMHDEEMLVESKAAAAAAAAVNDSSDIDSDNDQIEEVDEYSDSADADNAIDEEAEELAGHIEDLIEEELDVDVSDFDDETADMSQRAERSSEEGYFRGYAESEIRNSVRKEDEQKRFVGLEQASSSHSTLTNGADADADSDYATRKSNMEGFYRKAAGDA